MNKVLSSSIKTFAKITDVLELALEESPNLNAEWKLDVPPSFKTLKDSYTPYASTRLRIWLLTPSTPGEYVITCKLRKRCCGRRIISTKTFTVIVDK